MNKKTKKKKEKTVDIFGAWIKSNCVQREPIDIIQAPNVFIVIKVNK